MLVVGGVEVTVQLLAVVCALLVYHSLVQSGQMKECIWRLTDCPIHFIGPDSPAEAINSDQTDVTPEKAVQSAGCSPCCPSLTFSQPSLHHDKGEATVRLTDSPTAMLRGY